MRKGKRESRRRKKKKKREIKTIERKPSTVAQMWKCNYKAVLTGLNLVFYGSIIVFGSVAIIYAVLEYELISFELLKRLSLTFKQNLFNSMAKRNSGNEQDGNRQGYAPALSLSFLATSPYIKNGTLAKSDFDILTFMNMTILQNTALSFTSNIYSNFMNNYGFVRKLFNQTICNAFDSASPFTIPLLSWPLIEQMNLRIHGYTSKVWERLT